jgi:hypothetical protein
MNSEKKKHGKKKEERIKITAGPGKDDPRDTGP